MSRGPLPAVGSMAGLNARHRAILWLNHSGPFTRKGIAPDSVRSLEARGMVQQVGQLSANGSAKVYEVTDFGRLVVAA